MDLIMEESKKKKFTPVINTIYIKNKIKMLWINKIHNIILINDYHKFEQTIN